MGGRPLTDHHRIIHTILKGALKNAVRRKRLGVNPAEDDVWLPKVREKKPQTLDLDQISALVDYTRGTRLGPLWHLLATTGLRIGEATGLQWSDVDLEGMRLTVRTTAKLVPGGGFELGEPKTKDSGREVELDADVCAALREHRQGQRLEQIGAYDWTDLDLVFPGETGQILHPASARPVLYRACQALGLPRVKIHQLRHSVATNYLYELDEPTGIVQELLGHSHPSITAGTYGHPRRRAQRRAVDRMGEELRRRRKPQKASS